MTAAGGQAVASGRPPISLFSRDRRTHNLFRRAWLCAIEEGGYDPRVYLRGKGSGGAIRYILQFIRMRRGTRLIFGTAEIMLLCLFARAEDVFVFTGMGRLIQQGGMRARLTIRLLKTLNRGQRVIVLNNDDRRLLEPVFGKRISVLAGEGYTFVHGVKRKSNGGPIRLAYAGRLLRSKGVDTLIDACIQLGDQVRLLLMGDVDFDNKDAVDTLWLSRRIADAGGRIVHVGFVDDVRTRLAEADIYVSLSEREGLPFGVLDGINAGCALLLSDVPGHRDFADLPGVTFIDASGDSARLAAAIAQMIEHTDAYLAFDAKARLAICNARYGFEAIVSHIRGLLFGPMAELTGANAP